MSKSKPTFDPKNRGIRSSKMPKSKPIVDTENGKSTYQYTLPLKTEAVFSSETSVNYYVLEASNIRTRDATMKRKYFGGVECRLPPITKLQNCDYTTLR